MKDKTHKTFKLKNLNLLNKRKRRKAIKLFDFMARDFILKNAAPNGYRNVEGIYHFLPKTKGELPVTNRPFFFTAADANYIESFAKPFIGSICSNSPKTAVHIHIYNPESSTFSLISEINKNNPEIELTVSHETSNVITSLPLKKRIIYFQSMRFVRLWDIIRKTRAPSVALDIDSLVLGSMDSILMAANNNDIGIVLRPNAYDSSRRVLASFLYISERVQATRFLETSATIIANHLYYRVQTEMLDQRALWMALEKQLNNISIWIAPRRFYDYEFNKSSIIWQAKGKRKNDQRFQHEAMKYT